MSEAGQEYLDDMVRKRGYVLEYHKRLVGGRLRVRAAPPTSSSRPPT